MNRYQEMRDRQQATFDNFANQYCFFAYDKGQLEKGLAKLNAEKEDIVSFFGGGFVLKDQAEALRDLLASFSQETREQIEADPTGEEFIFEMFAYELANHEYSYTRNPHDAIEACGLTVEEVNGSETLRHGLRKAVLAYEEQ